MDVTKVLMRNYLPYAKGVIIDRAIPSIDGMKPANRKILYTMFKMGLINGDKTKSTNIVGQTMRIHPHGDTTIYDTLVRMATGNESLNVPYIESKGNFGKVYSRDLAYAASRYTEAKLAPVCKEIFDGIDEDAVEFVNNYDDTMQEPTLLPVKFPTILVNASNGIAVGMGSSIPSFGLNNVCESVIGIIDGKIKNADDLVTVIGIPQFTTGGRVHITQNEMAKILNDGHGSVTMTGTAVTYPNSIVITEIPYKTTAEAIISAIEEHVKSGELKEIANISDEIDLHGFKLVLTLKRGAVVSNVLRKLYIYTPFRSTISFNVRVIINNECRTMGVLELLNTWIEFRKDCIQRVYEYRLKKASDKEYFLSSWEKIKLDIRGVAHIIADKNETDAKAALMESYSLDEKQAEYLLDMKIREFTNDKLQKHLKELSDLRGNIAEYRRIIASDAAKYTIIKEDQQRIIDKYGMSNKTKLAAVLDLEKEKEAIKPESTDNDPVCVIITKSGYVKRVVASYMGSYKLPDNEEELKRFYTRNNDNLLVFTYDGTVYKVLVNSIDASRGKLTDTLTSLIGVSPKEIMFADMAGDYSKHFNLVYPNGRGVMVNYSKAAGKRSKYKSLFENCVPGTAFWTFEDKFFIVTRKRKAAYCDCSLLLSRTRTAFKVARISSGDYIIGIQPLKDVPNPKLIDLNKYSKEYTVLIKGDDLWEGASKAYYAAICEESKSKLEKLQAEIAEAEGKDNKQA